MGPLNFTYHDEVQLHAVLPAGSPVHGGTEVLVTGGGFAQSADVFTDGRVRCLFDAGDSAEHPDDPYVLPQV